MFGASGTIGRSTVRQLVDDGHTVTAVYRQRAPGQSDQDVSAGDEVAATTRYCDILDPASLARDAFGGGAFDAVISCLASRTGAPKDAWLVDYEANMNILRAAQAAGVRHMILLSAICVQKPMLAFQHAKLAFEKELAGSGLSYTIVRPTAFFKSLSGQIGRVQKGKPFLVFGDGTLTRCKPISDADLARFISGCLTDPAALGRILPIGGPGPAISPREQGEKLFELLGTAPRFRHIPIGLLDGVVAILGTLSHVSQRVAGFAEYARIARYYATQSMLVFNPGENRYSEEATPETGSDTLYDHYADIVLGGPASGSRNAKPTASRQGAIARE